MFSLYTVCTSEKSVSNFKVNSYHATDWAVSAPVQTIAIWSIISPIGVAGGDAVLLVWLKLNLFRSVCGF